LLVVIAGHNGAGKTTCYERHLKAVVGGILEEHINPDEVEKDLRAVPGLGALSDQAFSRMAQEEATRRRHSLLDGGSSFSFETVGSHEEKVAFIRKARDAGYMVALLFVGLESPEKSQERVALRVRRGGHNVAPDKIFSRYPRVLANMRDAVREATVALVVDNSQDGDPVNPNYLAVALFVGGEKVSAIGNPPDWVVPLL